MLTQKQHETLKGIKQFTKHYGYSPSVRELMHMIGSTSTGEVARLLKGLEDRGAIRRLKGRWRAIEVVETPSFHPEGLSYCTLAQLINEINRRGLVVGRVFPVEGPDGEVVKRKFQVITEEEVSHE